MDAAENSNIHNREQGQMMKASSNKSPAVFSLSACEYKRKHLQCRYSGFIKIFNFPYFEKISIRNKTAITTHVVKARVNGFLTYVIHFWRVILLSFAFTDSGMFAAALFCISCATLACTRKAAGNWICSFIVAPCKIILIKHTENSIPMQCLASHGMISRLELSTLLSMLKLIFDGLNSR